MVVDMGFCAETSQPAKGFKPPGALAATSGLLALFNRREPAHERVALDDVRPGAGPPSAGSDKPEMFGAVNGREP